jgi:hypothetical protein
MGDAQRRAGRVDDQRQAFFRRERIESSERTRAAIGIARSIVDRGERYRKRDEHRPELCVHRLDPAIFAIGVGARACDPARPWSEHGGADRACDVALQRERLENEGGGIELEPERQRHRTSDGPDGVASRRASASSIGKSRWRSVSRSAMTPSPGRLVSRASGALSEEWGELPSERRRGSEAGRIDPGATTDRGGTGGAVERGASAIEGGLRADGAVDRPTGCDC